MADENRPPVWGLWNDALGEWFNPGTRKPYFNTRDEAERRVPIALRQYAFGKWVIREYPLDGEFADSETPLSPAPTAA
jgi:hypothetical protein